MFRIIKPQTNIQKIFAGLIAILALAGILAMSVRFGSTYQTQKAYLGEISSDIEASGTLSAHQSVTLNWQAAGVVEKVTIQIGQQVKKDQKLATLKFDSIDNNILLGYSDLADANKTLDDLRDPTSAESQAWNDLVQAKHDLADEQIAYDALVNPRGGIGLNEYLQDDIDDAQAQLDQLNFLWELFYAKLNDHNTKKLQMIIRITQAQQRLTDQIHRYNWFNGHPNQSVADQGLAKLNIAKGKLADAQRNYDKVTSTHNSDAIRQAQLKWDAATATVSRSAIISPINGKVTDLQVLPGDKVQNGKYAITVEDLSTIGIDLLISEVDIPNITTGMEAEVKPHSADGMAYKGIVSSVDMSGRKSNGVMMYKVRIDLVEPDAQLMSGMSADVVIKVASYNQALLIPSSAIRFFQGERLVFVLRNNQPVPVHIRVGALKSDLAQVVGGNLKIGDEVIMNPPVVSEIDPSLVQ